MGGRDKGERGVAVFWLTVAEQGRQGGQATITIPGGECLKKAEHRAFGTQS